MVLITGARAGLLPRPGLSWSPKAGMCGWGPGPAPQGRGPQPKVCVEKCTLLTTTDTGHSVLSTELACGWRHSPSHSRKAGITLVVLQNPWMVTGSRVSSHSFSRGVKAVRAEEHPGFQDGRFRVSMGASGAATGFPASLPQGTGQRAPVPDLLSLGLSDPRPQAG